MSEEYEAYMNRTPQQQISELRAALVIMLVGFLFTGTMWILEMRPKEAIADEPTSLVCTGEATGTVYKSASDNTPLNLRITLTCR